MHSYSQRIQFSFEFSHPVEKVWEHISNTDRINRAAGLSGIEYRHVPDPDGGSTRYGKLKAMEWLEHPYEWERFKYYQYVRTYTQGPFREVFIHLKMEPTAKGCSATMTFDFDTRRAWTGRIVKYFMRKGVVGGFLHAWSSIEAFLSQPMPEAVTPFCAPEKSAYVMDASTREALERKLAQSGRGELSARAIQLISGADDPDLFRIKPFKIAKSWKQPEVETLKFFLAATRAGVFSLSWDMICPGCRGAKGRAQTLQELKQTTHCDTCNISFDANFDRSVEVSFNLNPAIRKVSMAEYCVGGPQNTPHVLLQQRLGASSKKTVEIEVGEGTYMLVCPQSKQRVLLHVEAGAAKQDVEIKLVRGSSHCEEIRCAPGRMAVSIANQFDREVLFLAVRAAWMDDACTAAFVTSLQEFREAFSSEVLRPGQELTVGAVALLFTDLKGSTAMYQRIGDATAFRLVREHFDILTECVKRNNGGIVKTIGDAVMAAFVRAEDAVRAAIEMQQGIDEKNQGADKEKLRVKVGIHYGPCYAVNMNERLDYFGAVVNIAARTEGQCEGGDIVVSKEVFEEPGVNAAIRSAGLSATKMTRALKGFEREFELYKIPCIGYLQMQHGADTRSA